MYEASAEVTKTITRAISSGVPRRLTGTVETSAALFSAVLVKRVSIPVSVVPEQLVYANAGPCYFQCGGLGHSFDRMFAGDANRCARSADASVGR